MLTIYKKENLIDSKIVKSAGYKFDKKNIKSPRQSAFGMRKNFNRTLKHLVHQHNHYAHTCQIKKAQRYTRKL